MDQILAKASNQAVSFAIRSGISLASGYAIKTISTFLSQIPASAQQRIESKRLKLKTKIDIINITLDLIRLASARGNTVLEHTMVLIDDLDLQFTEFDHKIDEITRNLTGGNEEKSIAKVEKYMAELLAEINDAIPILNMSLLTSGVNMNGSVDFTNSTAGISPGRLLQAAQYITTDNKEKGQNHELGVVGPVFDLVTYTIFYNPSRMKYVNDGNSGVVDELSYISWKETFARTSVKIISKRGEEFQKGKLSLKYSYSLEIREDYNDGRYHDEDDKPIVKKYDLKSIQSMFFTASGKLLRLEGRNSPVLILKLVNEQSDEEWIAFGELHHGEFDDDDDDDDDEEEEETDGSNKKSKESKVKTIKKEKKTKVNTVSKEAIKNSSLSLLEYTLRLAKLQQTEQASILDTPDEVLKLYLHDQTTTKTNLELPKTLTHKHTEANKAQLTEEKIKMDSNILRMKHLAIDSEAL